MDGLDRIAARYGDTLYRVALQYLRHSADAEDILQDVLLECCGRRPAFTSEDHERYWLIRVTINKCKNLLRQRKRRHTVPLHDAAELPAPPEPSYRALYDAVNALPRDQRMAVELFYGQGYATAEVETGAVSNLLAPLFGGARTELRGTTGVPLGASDSAGGYTLTVNAMIGDQYAFAVVYTFSRDDGQPIPEEATFEDWDSKRCFDGSGYTHMHGFPDESDPSRMHFVETWMGSGPLVSRVTTTKLSGLYLPGEEDGEDVLLARGPWKVRFNLLYEDATVRLPMEGLTVTDEAGGEYELHEILLSPVGLHMDLSAPIPSEADHGSPGKDVMDRFTVSVLLRNGSAAELVTSNAGGAWNREKDEAASAWFNAFFQLPVPLEEMEALVLCGTTYPIELPRAADEGPAG